MLRMIAWFSLFALIAVAASPWFRFEYRDEPRYVTRVVTESVRRDAGHFGNAFVDEVTGIYDGDTFHVTIHGWPPVAGKHIAVRIAGIDTPERRARCARERQLANQARQFLVWELRDARQIELRKIRRGKYFRIVAEVYVDGSSLADRMIHAGHARTYAGGKRKSWCN